MTNFQKTCRLSRPGFSAVACYMEKQNTRISSCVFFYAHGRRGHTNPEFYMGNQCDWSAYKKNQRGWGFLDEALPKKPTALSPVALQEWEQTVCLPLAWGSVLTPLTSHQPLPDNTSSSLLAYKTKHSRPQSFQPQGSVLHNGTVKIINSKRFTSLGFESTCVKSKESF